MSTVTRPRGPLPARVYWVRRALLLGVPLALVVVLAMVFSGGDDPAPDAGAAQVDAPTSEATQEPTPQQTRPTDTQEPTTPPPAEPSGPCDPADVVVVPSVGSAVAGRDVPVKLTFSTRTSDACTVDLSGESLAVTVTSGSDEVWTSRHCAQVVPTQEVVARRETTTHATMTWNARRSDDGCPKLTDFAGAGYYHVETALKGGEPSSVQFRLLPPGTQVQSDEDKSKDKSKDGDKSKGKNKNKGKGKGKNRDKNRDGSDTSPGDDPTHEPSGAVEPDATQEPNG